MKVLNELSVKDLKLNKKRSIVIIIGIILSTALICAVAGLITSFQQTFIETAKNSKGNYHAIFYDVPKEELKYIEENNIELAEEIKASMFVFDDIVRLEDTAIQRILKEVNVKDIAYALKGASNDVSNAIYRNQSQRAAAALKEEIELLGKTKVSQVEESQQNKVNIIRKLEEIGEITLTRGSDEEFVL